MDYAGTPQDCNDDCLECEYTVIGPMPSASGQAPTIIEQTNPRRTDRSPRDCRPFVLQSGRSLFIVAEEGTGWVVAELSFEPIACMFTEVSRVRFQWPREAFGRLLSRTYSGAGDDHDVIDRVTDDFQRWLASQFVA